MELQGVSAMAPFSHMVCAGYLEVLASVLGGSPPPGIRIVGMMFTRNEGCVSHDPDIAMMARCLGPVLLLGCSHVTAIKFQPYSANIAAGTVLIRGPTASTQNSVRPSCGLAQRACAHTAFLQIWQIQQTGLVGCL